MTQYQHTFLNPNLPHGGGARAYILASAQLRSWWQVDPDTVTLSSGAVAQIAPLGGASAALLSGADPRRPTYADGVLGGRFPLALFDGADDRLDASAVPYTQTGAWSWAWCGRVDAQAEDQHLVALWTVSSNGSRIRVSPDGTVSLQHGSGTVVAPDKVTLGQPCMIVAVSNGTTISIAVRGGSFAARVATDNVNTAGVLRLGAANASGVQPMRGGLSDLIIWQRDISADAALLAEIAAMAEYEYGVDIA